MTMEELRDAINQIDSELLRLFNQRAALALEIGHIKKKLGLPIYDPQREKLIFERMRQDNPGPLDDAAVVRLYERVIDESRSLERAKSRKDKPS
ncbi:MAG: chorismate mutase [Deltaproteobacteria bacterium]|nr:chorismate mutase [Deltaproteobacteria bacterium]NCP02766.1 chorismate mutase [Deltaproteobacteria bacterium]